jgi:hypothetical protein
MPVLRYLAAVVVLAAAFVAGGAHLRVLTPAQAQTARCANIQLYVTPQRSNGSAGHIAILYQIHNIGGSACSLYGYPGIQLLDRSFHDLPTFSHRGALQLNGRRTPTTVIVPAHGSAWFAVEYQDIPADNGTCEFARYLMIFPPNDYLPVVARAGQGGSDVRACAGQIGLSPVTAATGGI